MSDSRSFLKHNLWLIWCFMEQWPISHLALLNKWHAMRLININVSLKEATFWGKFPGNMYIYIIVFKNIHLHTMSSLSTVSRNSMQWLITGYKRNNWLTKWKKNIPAIRCVRWNNIPIHMHMLIHSIIITHACVYSRNIHLRSDVVKKSSNKSYDESAF